jgi:hypothetical protein
MCGGTFFVDSEEEMMKTRSCLKIFESAKHSKPPNHDLGCHSSNIVSYLKPRNMKVKNRIMRGKSLPIVGQHFNKQAIVPDFDRSQRKVWFQDTLQSQ